MPPPKRPTIGELMRAGENPFATAVPGFWEKMAKVRDEKLAAHPVPVEGPHDRCRRRKVRDLLMSNEECADCGAAKIAWMLALKRPSYIRAAGERFSEMFELCRVCHRRECACRYDHDYEEGQQPW